jgi:hypothetical protein
MAWDFPASPTPGQVFNPGTGLPTYTFIDGRWIGDLGEAPRITSTATFSQPENAAFSTTLAASESVTWSLVGGPDVSKFAIGGSTLSMPAKDYEAPIDANGDNVYQVTVQATDALGNTARQAIAVTITDVIEGGGNFSITDTHQQSTDVVANPYTLTAKSIGAADTTRIVLFCLQYYQGHTGRAIPVVTCDGSEMQLVAMNNRASSNAPCQIWAIKKPTGTASDFVITFRTPDANPNVPRFNAFFVRAINMALAPSDFTGGSNAAGGTGTATITLDGKADNGGLIVAIGGQDAPATPTETWTGLTKDQTLATETMRTHLAHWDPVANEAPRAMSYATNGGGSVTVGPLGAALIALSPAANTRKLVWDTFDRSNGGLDTTGGKVVTGFSNAGDWVAGGSTPYLNINTNRLENQNTAGAGCMHSFDLGGTDMWVEWDVEVLSSSGPFSCLRMIDNDNFIGIRASNTDIECYRRQAGSMNNLLTSNWDLSFGVLMRIEAEGTALRFYRNGELMTTQTLAAPFLTPTKAGLIGRSVNYNGFLSRFRCGIL